MDLNVISCRMERSIPGSSYQAHTSYNEFHHKTALVAFRPHRVNVMIELHQLLPLVCMHTSAHTSMHTHMCKHSQYIPFLPFWCYFLLGFWFGCRIFPYFSISIAIHLLHLLHTQDHMIQFLSMTTHIIRCHASLDVTGEMCFEFLFIFLL